MSRRDFFKKHKKILLIPYFWTAVYAWQFMTTRSNILHLMTNELIEWLDD